MALQPFDKHPANLGSLESCGNDLIQQAAGSLDNAQATQQAYQPAIVSWTGSCAPDIASANDAVKNGSSSASSSLAWAAVVTQYWGTEVKSFNDEVDRIVVPIQNPPAGQTPAQALAVLQQARTAWWTAYDTFIETGGNQAASMLKDGPSQGNVSLAKQAGVLPQSTTDVWDDIWNSGKGVFLPPSSLGWPGYSMWGLGKLGFAAGTGASWMQKVSIGRFAPRDDLGRWVSPNDLSWWQTAKAAGDDSSWVAKAGQAGTYSRWGTVGEYAKWGGTALAFAGGAWSQWSQDEDNQNLDTTAKVGRATYRGAMTAAGGYVGAEVGGEAGAAIGTMICPGVGTVVGGVVGGLVGAVVGSGVANAVVDKTVQFAGDVADDAKDVVDDIGGAISSIF